VKIHEEMILFAFKQYPEFLAHANYHFKYHLTVKDIEKLTNLSEPEIRIALDSLMRRKSVFEVQEGVFWLAYQGQDDIGRLGSSSIERIEEEITKRGSTVYADSQRPDTGNKQCKHNVLSRTLVEQFGGDTSVHSRICEAKGDDKLKQMELYKRIERYRVPNNTVSNRCPFSTDLQNIYLCPGYEPL
jgi:hypothetical protein